MQKITKEQISEWKKLHGDLFKISVGDKACILKKPSRKALSYGSSVGTNDPVKFNEIVLKDCWVAGDEEIKTDDYLFLAVASKIAHIIEIKESTLEKL